MCGIFGVISHDKALHFVDRGIKHLAQKSMRRGSDSSGIIALDGSEYCVHRADFSIMKLLADVDISTSKLVMGHTRLITNGMSDNQPVVKDGVVVLHNGIITNEVRVWEQIERKPDLEIDTEIIADLIQLDVGHGKSLAASVDNVLSKCQGAMSCAVLLPHIGKLMLFSNTGSLFTASSETATYFASEKSFLASYGLGNITQVGLDPHVFDVPACEGLVNKTNRNVARAPLVSPLSKLQESSVLNYTVGDLKRCNTCILPETMPFISFNENGTCNYCENYSPRNIPRPVSEIQSLLDPYRKTSGPECIVPFSGGRDSCYGLHLIINELNLKPITYTYDWGMVTDLGRRNISRMCSQLGVENIIVAADIRKKRDNIAKNLAAWLKSPDLGMVSILTAGDKHFFRYVENIKRETAVSLNLWGVNPLEVTHFKAGFLGVPPYFSETHVYSNGILKQMRYQSLRFKAMRRSPGYFNASLWDTLSGEYFRSFHKKSDYFHIFDYWRWEEEIINKVLIEDYDWELAPDTNTTWRIGDGTAAFYNYIYQTVAGFTEHDTFRSNQIREGDLSRDEALMLVQDENRPRYQNIKWYLDAVGMDFKAVIETVNKIPRLHPSLY